MLSTTTGGIPIEVLLSPDEWARELRDEAVAGLTSSPKELAPTWFYDDTGSELFEQITGVAEYYPTRAERAILAARARDIAITSQADTLVELGAGTSQKTRILLDALQETGRLERFVPFDVAEATLRATAEAIADEYPGLDVHAVVGDFRRHLDALPTDGRRLVAFLGGTIGNLRPGERSAMLAELASSMRPGDSLLLGTDLVKNRERLVAAYDDAAGVTAAFNKNVLRVLNRELGADFDVDRFEHVALFDEDNEWIEMRLRSQVEQDVQVPGLGLTLHFAPGEDLRTEISAKFSLERVRAELGTAGLELTNWWTDPAGDYALSLSFRP
jgi:L-histidine N-alpha-methyltransferase